MSQMHYCVPSPPPIPPSCLLALAVACTDFLTSQEKDDWIGAIGRAIVQASSTYQGDNNNGDSDSDDDYDYR